VIERLLVRAPNWLGDVVLSLAAVRDLRRNFPAARIEVLARSGLAELYRAVPELDAVRESLGVRHDARAIGGAFDAALLLPNSFGSALPPFLARIRERWGYATDGRGPLLTRRARVARDALRGLSEVYYYRAMLAGVGLRVSAAPELALECPQAWRDAARPRLAGAERWVGVAPGAAFGAAKRWIPARYAETAERVAQQLDAGVVILGTAAERALGDAIAGPIAAPVVNLCGQTGLAELAGVLSRLTLLISNDSGPMHLAAALDVPLVAVFGPTDWRETGPFRGRHRVVREDVECAPCKLRACPIDHRCMKRVSAETVAREALDLVGRPG